MDVAWGDSDAASALGVFAGAWGDDSGAVGADEARFAALHLVFHPDHIVDGNAFSDGDSEVEACVNGFKDGVCRKRRGHEDGGYGSSGFTDGFIDGVEDGDAVGAVFEELATFAGGDSGDDGGAVVEGELGVAGTEGAGDALNENPCVGFDEDGQVMKWVREVRIRLGGLDSGDDFFCGVVEIDSADDG